MVTKKTVCRRELPEKGDSDSLQILGRGLGKKEGNALSVDYLSPDQVGFSYPAFIELVRLTLAPINI